MELRKLGTSDLHITPIGFGAWAIGGGGWEFGWGPQDEGEALAAIHKAIELGINWVDTAPVYGLGHSEELVGRAIRGKRDRIIIATKCSLVWDSEGKISANFTKQSVRRECEQSLKRLGIEEIDLYQVHWPRDEEHLEEGWEEMSRLVKEGKVRYLGVSNFNVPQMERVRKIHPITSLQPPYSLLRRGIEVDVIPYCRQHNIGILAYSPMHNGLLSGRFDRSRLAPDDWRNRATEFNEPNLSVNLWFVEELKPIAQKYGKTPGQLAIAWTLRLPEITAAIVGARNPHQVEENLGGWGWNIDKDDLETIDRLLDERANRIRERGGVVKE